MRLLMIEIRWHSRGGQGGWTASNLTAMAASYEGKFVQSFPAFGPERSGAPIMSFTRISDEPIEIHSMIYEPDIVVVLDYTLLSPGLLSGLKGNGIVVSNYTGDVQRVLDSLGIKRGDYKLVLIPASKLALEVLKAKVTNTAMLSGLIKLGIIKLESVEKAIRERFSGPVAERNIVLVKKALEEAVVM
ncbi:MAG: 2-oxoacid:acceptor oxidoreductase family protein [Desulfurococcaceae archaeon]